MRNSGKLLLALALLFGVPAAAQTISSGGCTTNCTLGGTTTLPGSNNSIDASGNITVRSVTTGTSASSPSAGEVQVPAGSKIYSGNSDTSQPYLLLFNGGTNTSDLQTQSAGLRIATLGVTGFPVSTDNKGHLNIVNGAAPTIASGACGTGTNGSISGGDQSGQITIGASSTTSCAVTFGAQWAIAPRACTESPATLASAATTVLPYISALTSSGFTLSGSVLASTSFYYTCL